MSETIQMRTTQEQSGDYRVFAAKGDDPVKGLAIHTDLIDRLDGEPDYVAVTFEEGGAIQLEAEKFTGSTFRVSNQPAVRHAYFEPQFVAGFDYDGDLPTEETFDCEGFPAIGISDLSVSDEETYDEEQNTSAEEAADALFGEGEADDSDEENDAENGDTDNSEPADESEEVGVSDEEIGITQ
mgnify:CR=1 FL=1